MSNIHLFGQVASLIPRDIVEKSAKEHKSNYRSKKFDTWHHLITMLFCHMGNCKSLREITQCLESATGNLSHLGMKKSPSRNALSYMNAKRSWKVFKDIYLALYASLGQQIHRDDHELLNLKRKVYLLDSSYITLCASLFDWAHYTHEKGAIKLHTLLDFEGLLPSYIYVSDGKLSDSLGAYHAFPPSHSIIVCDRGYCDSELWHDWDSNDIQFVVRFKSDIEYRRIGEFDQPADKEQNILIDECIELTGETTSKNYKRPLRRIAVWDEKNEQTIELVTNIAKKDAQIIADLYKNRWYIESFFKMIKQLLNVKTFIGTSENAVLCQIWTAMISALLLLYLKSHTTRKWALSNLCAFLRVNLLVKINLWEWLNETYIAKLARPPDPQPTLL